MKFEISLEKNKSCDVYVTGIFEEEKFVFENVKIANAVNNSKKFKGEYNSSKLISTLGESKFSNVLVFGLGKKEDFTLEKLRNISANAVKLSVDEKYESVFLDLIDVEKVFDNDIKVQTIVEGSTFGKYNFDRYKSEKKEIELKKIYLFSKSSISQSSIKKGLLLAETVCKIRDYVNTPPVDATPSYLADQAVRMCKKNKVKVTVFGKKDLEKKKMGAILGVSKGSSQEPKMVIMQTNPKAKSTVAVCGKGITFDSGGLNLKLGDGMLHMKYDMAGSAVVLGLIEVISQLNLPINVMGIMALSENMTGASAQKPGDIVTAYNGKTIEIGNTDAEGRLVLADAISYAAEHKPELIIDCATLTGAAVVTLGYSAAAMISNNDNAKNQMKQSGEFTHERVWELPLWDEFREAVKGDLADVRNIGNMGKGYEAGTITAATFLENFVNNIPWVHLDIAPTSFRSSSSGYLPKGATGYGVRLLTNFLENYKAFIN